MSHSQSFDAIVLKTYDVGEADRFCILLTREKGRLMARAAGARRTGSRLGGSLLPFRRLNIQLKESSAGWIIAGVASVEMSQPLSLPSFAALEEGIEILLRLVQHEGELPEIFDATLLFIADPLQVTPLAYTFSLLHHLGLLPEEPELTAMFGLEEADHAFLEACRTGSPAPAPSNQDLLRHAQSHFLALTLTSPLKATAISNSLR